MSLARVKTWNPGDVLTAADLNGEFNNILNNPISLASPTTGPINFNLQAHTNLLPSVITGTSASAGQVLIVTSSGTAANFGTAIPADSRVRGLRGLLSSQIGTFSADSYVQRTTDGLRAWAVTATSSYDASVGTAGPAAGGRDKAGAFASTYVHWYAITTGPGSTAPAGLVSTNPPNVGPAALPTGYLGWTYLGGSVYSSASTTLVTDHQFRGSKAWYKGLVSVLSGGAALTETAVGVSAPVPSNALNFTVQSRFLLNALSSATSFPIATIRTITGFDYFQHQIFGNTNAVTAGSAQVTLPNIGNSFFYIVSTSAGSPSYNLDVMGYENPNGDV